MSHDRDWGKEDKDDWRSPLESIVRNYSDEELEAEVNRRKKEKFKKEALEKAQVEKTINDAKATLIKHGYTCIPTYHHMPTTNTLCEYTDDVI